MSCRRAYDLDLAAFLADPRAPELAEFVEHYPRCPECAAEVRAWTEVHLALASRHPAPAELLAYHDGSLGADARAMVGRHLATCPACAEELRAVQRFDVTRVPAALAPRPRRATPAGSVARRIGRVLWHPAVAYAVALLLLVPVLAQRPWETPPPAREPAPAGDAEGLAPASRPRSVVETTRPVTPAQSAEPRQHDAAQSPPMRTFGTQELARSQPAPAPPAGAAAPDAAAKRDMPATRAAAPGPILEEDGRTLAIPLAPALRSRDRVEVRIRDAGGTRELRQQVAPSDGADRLLVELPREWLTPGDWTVEVQAPGDVRRFPLRVR
jgi:anti-sigma factor RsiW